MTELTSTAHIKLHYTILCEDVRLEINHKLTLIGIFYAIQVPQMPVTLLKMAVLNHWSGEGQYLSEVRILTPDRTQPVAVSPPSSFQIPPDGYADNVTMFANISFPAPGNYIVQTLINSSLYAETTLPVVMSAPPSYVESDTVQ